MYSQEEVGDIVNHETAQAKKVYQALVKALCQGCEDLRMLYWTDAPAFHHWCMAMDLSHDAKLALVEAIEHEGPEVMEGVAYEDAAIMREVAERVYGGGARPPAEPAQKDRIPLCDAVSMRRALRGFSTSNVVPFRRLNQTGAHLLLEHGLAIRTSECPENEPCLWLRLHGPSAATMAFGDGDDAHFAKFLNLTLRNAGDA